MSKIISVADDVYNELKAMKGSESYSSVIRKALRKGNKTALLKLFSGKAAGFDEETLKGLDKMWKKWTNEYA